MALNLIERRLNPGQPYKPLDFGNGSLAGSIAPDGRLLSLSFYHPSQGYVVLSAIPPFPDEQRHDQAAVRAYRADLAKPDAAAFGVHLVTGDASGLEVYLLADAIPQSRWQTANLQVRVTTWAPHLAGQPVTGALQQWRFYNPGTRAAACGYHWDGPLSLSRASYTQLTERGPLPLPPPTLHLLFDQGELSIVAPDVDAAALILGLPAGESWRQSGQNPLSIKLPDQLTIPPGRSVELTLIFALARTLDQARPLAAALAESEVHRSLAESLETRRKRWAGLDVRLSQPLRSSNLPHRAQTYILDCCALPVDEGLCLLTDHQILPLSWTRDAYFLCQAIPRETGAGIQALMRRHLIWLFELAQRPDVYWGRAYLANGRPKDRVFQLDQQCYPLLEFAEYLAIAADEALFDRLSPHLPAILDLILTRRAPSAALFATEESPGDDPIPLPYHFSSQILLWHTLRQLAQLNVQRPFTSLDLDALSKKIQADTLQHMVTEEQGRRLFAYATDLQGHYHFYHDANDLPTVLAPLWGFCRADDPVWRATMDFAFTPANRGGYYAGSVGGLGSVHTQGPWPLGDVQEFVYARLTGHRRRARAVLTRLVNTACWDGSLPEARDENRGGVRSRHWFGWPGAALVAAVTHPAWQS